MSIWQRVNTISRIKKAITKSGIRAINFAKNKAYPSLTNITELIKESIKPKEKAGLKTLKQIKESRGKVSCNLTLIGQSEEQKTGTISLI